MNQSPTPQLEPNGPEPQRHQGKTEKKGWLSALLRLFTGFGVIVGLLFTGYQILEGNLRREQDADLNYIERIEARLYDVERENPRVFCVYGRYSSVVGMGCQDADRHVSTATAYYGEIALDLASAVTSYDGRWDQPMPWPLNTAVQECLKHEYAPFLTELGVDQTGFFAEMARVKFGSLDAACDQFGLCIGALRDRASTCNTPQDW
jgi:hypothetical protein